MSRVILQGPALAEAEAIRVSAELNGNLATKSSYFEINTEKRITLSELSPLRHEKLFDINLLSESFAPKDVRLLVTDMDSTLINIECIDEIADFIDVKEQVAAITESAMRGEINFERSLKERVKLLTGLDQNALEQVYSERLNLNPGAEEMVEALHQRGIKIALVSGGFTFFTERLKKRLGLDYTLANTLEIKNNHLTGSVEGDIIGAQAKADFLLQRCRELNISPQQTVAIGDGANDLPMMRQAGLSIAYHAKPAVQKQADCALNHSGLEGVLGLLQL